MAQLIEWKNDFELKEEHFKGKPDLLSKHDAATSSGPDIFFHIIDDKEYFVDSIKAFFNCNKSWMRKPASKRLLDHEKLHFDITELHVRKLRSKYDSLEKNGIFERDIYDNLLELNQLETKRMHQKYDRETDHSKNGVEQEKWNNKIQALLKED